MNNATGSEWYFAYGANMATRVLERRGLRWAESRPGVLADYRWTIAVPGLPLVEPGFATVQPCAGAHVHGVLYRMASSDLAALDSYEADQDRFEVDVSSRSETFRATTYRSHRFQEGLRCSRRYRRLLLEGASQHALPEPWIAMLSDLPVAYFPVLSELFGGTLWLVERASASIHRLVHRDTPSLGEGEEPGDS